MTCLFYLVLIGLIGVMLVAAQVLRFVKMHGLGNDFVVVDGIKRPAPDEALWPELARHWCDRHFGIGADGLVFLMPSAGADLEMRIINPDGSEPEMCGNAIRCVAKYAYENLGMQADTLSVATRGGLKSVRPAAENGQVRSVKVDMGRPVLEPQDIPVLAPAGPVVNWPLEVAGSVLNITAVSMGNPHCVVFVSDLDQVSLKILGPAVETHPAFPRRANLELVQVLTPTHLRVKVWERGAGVTLACGTGACASAVAGVLNQVSRSRVRVSLPGGDLVIAWENPDSSVWMEGPASEAFRGEIEYEGKLVQD